jgi:hypothetical protein
VVDRLIGSLRRCGVRDKILRFAIFPADTSKAIEETHTLFGRRPFINTSL